MASKGNKPITEIAEQLGLSPGTISIVLNGRGDQMRISKKTQKRVKDLAKEMGYHPNIYARRLRNARREEVSQVIAVFWNSGYADEIMGSFFRRLTQVSIEKEYHAEFYVHMFEYGQLRECEHIMNSSRFSGAIICGISDADADFLNSREFDIPIVCAFRQEKRYHSVYVNDYDVGADAVQLFFDRGHRKIGFIGSSISGPNSVHRQRGFCDRCQKLGISLPAEWIQKENGRDFASGYAAMEKMLVSAQRPTAIFINAPQLALGAVAACQDRGIGFQKEIEVLSVGSSKDFEYFQPSVSTVCTPTDMIAEDSLSLLMAAARSEMDRPVSRIVDAKYIFGDTCGGIQAQ